MDVWSITRLTTQIENVRGNGRTDMEGQLLYILNPFIASLGYDIYDITKVDTQIQSGRMIVQAHEDVRIIFSVSSTIPKQSGNIHVTIDAKRNVMEMRLYAMDNWELVERLDLSQNPEEVSETYANIIRVISLESCHIMYAERGKRMFTERILATKLAEGDMQNEFLVAAVKQLFNQPTDALIACIADVLAEEYSTESVYTLQEQLAPLKEVGMRSLVSRYLQDINIPEEPSKTQVERVPTTPPVNPIFDKPEPQTIPPISVKQEPSESEIKKSTSFELEGAAAIVEQSKEEEIPKPNASTESDALQDLGAPTDSPKPVLEVEEHEVVAKEEAKRDTDGFIPPKPVGGSIEALFGAKPATTYPKTKSL